MNYSDSESLDSDEGVRYKTESTRYKSESNLLSSKKADSCENIKKIIGPQLPLEQENSTKLSDVESSAKDSSEEDSYFGPALPPHLVQKESNATIGPQLPPGFQKPSPTPESSAGEENNTNELACIGPVLPPHLRNLLQNDTSSKEESDDEGVYGPLPPDAVINSKSQIALEERALELKLNQLDPQKAPPTREEWMLELPEVKAAKFGLGPRQFRSKIGPDLSDRSSWTDTPDKKEKPEEKIDLKKIAEMKETKRKDAEQERMAKKFKSNKESLLESHQTKMKEKQKDLGPAERRPFNRETDLQVNRFDEAQKKAVLKKAQLLDDRFSSGQSKFL